MRTESDWEQRYQNDEAGWDRGQASPNLTYWIDHDQGLLKPCRILVPGCGNGHEVMALAQLGFDVVAIDFAPSPIENLKRALEAIPQTAELIQADFFDCRFEKPFDAIYEQTSLCALQPETWPRYEQCLLSWLRPGGYLFAQFMQTGEDGGPPYHCDVAAMKDIFPTDRWLWSDAFESGVVHTGGKFEKLFRLEKRAKH